MTKASRILTFLAIGFVSVLCLTVALLLIVSWRNVPQYHGEIKLEGLKSSVDITFDRHGIPHIEAQNSSDFYFAFGRLVASERLFQMDIHRRLSSGTLSELFGQKALEFDQYYATFALYEIGETLLADMPEEIVFALDRYFAGVNDFIKNGSLPVEYYFLRAVPAPFSKRDAMSFIGHLSLSFSLGMRQDPLMSKIKQQLPENIYRELLTMRPERLLANYDQGSDYSFTGLAKKHLEALMPLGFYEGSNAWLLGPLKTESGGAILASDPHISYSLPGIWYEAHYKIEDIGHEMYGHFLPLIPIPVLGHNQEFGWGLTMSYTDDLDLYKEKIDFDKESYLEDGEWKPLEKRVRTFKVRGQPSVEKVYYKTKIGPVFNDLLEEGDLKVPLSLRWSHYYPDNKSIEAFWRMNRASNMEDFSRAISLARAPGLNVLYADRKGNIAQWLFGDVWLRGNENTSYEVLDASNKAHRPLVALPLSLRPNIVNPVDGQIVSANQRPILAEKDILGDWHSDDRYVTIEEQLFTKEKWSVEDTKALQTSNLNLKTKVFVRELTALLSRRSDDKKISNILEEFKKWDGKSQVDSIAPTVLYVWIENFGQKALALKLNEKDREEYSWLNSYWIFVDRIFREPHNIWWEDNEGREAILELALNDTIELLSDKFGEDVAKWQWGKIHTLSYKHPLGNVALLAPIFNLGPYAVGGAYNEINNMKHMGAFKGEFEVKAGPSTRRVIDFSNAQVGHGILPIGNSGHMFSPFYRDQLPLYIRGEYRPMIINWEKLQEEWAHSKLKFIP